MFIISVALFTAICAADKTLELLDVFRGIADMNETTESCAYDTVNDKWIFFSNDGSSIAYNTLPGSYPDISLEDEDFVQGAYSVPLAYSFPLGTMFVAGEPNKVYIAGFLDSTISSYNIDDATFSVKEINIPSLPTTNGLCYDAENDVLYAAATGLNLVTGLPFPGAATIYKISGISNDSMNVTMKSIPTTPLKDQNGDVVIETNPAYAGVTGIDRVLHPNGCTVYDGKVYFVETRSDTVGNLGIYDIESDELTLNTEILSDLPCADGLVVVDNYLIYSSYGSDLVPIPPHMGYYDLSQYPDGTFTKALVYTINGGADIAYNPNTNVICVPKFDTVGTPSTIEFVRFMDAPTTTLDDDSAANYISVIFGIIAICISYIML